MSSFGKKGRRSSQSFKNKFFRKSNNVNVDTSISSGFTVMQQPLRIPTGSNAEIQGTCILNSVMNEELGYDKQYGAILVYDKNTKDYDSPTPFHSWNVDKNGKIYDDFNNLENFLNEGGFKTVDNIRNLKVRIVDGSNWPSAYTADVMNRYVKKFRQNKNEIIYVKNYCFDPNMFGYRRLNNMDMEAKYDVARQEVINHYVSGRITNDNVKAA